MIHKGALVPDLLWLLIQVDVQGQLRVQRLGVQCVCDVIFNSEHVHVQGQLLYSTGIIDNKTQHRAQHP